MSLSVVVRIPSEVASSLTHAIEIALQMPLYNSDIEYKLPASSITSRDRTCPRSKSMTEREYTLGVSCKGAK